MYAYLYACKYMCICVAVCEPVYLWAALLQSLLWFLAVFVAPLIMCSIIVDVVVVVFLATRRLSFCLYRALLLLFYVSFAASHCIRSLFLFAPCLQADCEKYFSLLDFLLCVFLLSVYCLMSSYPLAATGSHSHNSGDRQHCSTPNLHWCPQLQFLAHTNWFSA